MHNATCVLTVTQGTCMLMAVIGANALVNCMQQLPRCHCLVGQSLLQDERHRHEGVTPDEETCRVSPPSPTWWAPRQDLTASWELMKGNWLNVLIICAPLGVIAYFARWGAAPIFLLVSAGCLVVLHHRECILAHIQYTEGLSSCPGMHGQSSPVNSRCCCYLWLLPFTDTCQDLSPVAAQFCLTAVATTLGYCHLPCMFPEILCCRTSLV